MIFVYAVFFSLYLISFLYRNENAQNTLNVTASLVDWVKLMRKWIPEVFFARRAQDYFCPLLISPAAYIYKSIKVLRTPICMLWKRNLAGFLPWYAQASHGKSHEIQVNEILVLCLVMSVSFLVRGLQFSYFLYIRGYENYSV